MREHLVGQLRVDRADVVLERRGVGDVHAAGHQRALVAVQPGDERHGVLPAGAVHRQRVVRNGPAVDVRSPDVAGPQERAARVGVRGRQHIGGARGAHRGQRLVGIPRDPECRGNPHALRLGRLPAARRFRQRPVPAVDPVALGDGPVEQPLCLRNEHDRHDRAAAGRLPEDRHPAGIAAERRDVVADPLERRHHVQQAVVPGCAVRRLGRQGRVREEAEDVEAVVDGDHHRPVGGERHAVVDGGRSRAARVAAAVDPEQHRPRLTRLARGPDVEEQAVLVLGDVPSPVLDADRPALRRVAHAFPADDRLGRTPAQVADRGRGVGDTLEGDDRVVASGDGAPDGPAGDHDGRIGVEDDLGAGRSGAAGRENQCDRRADRGTNDENAPDHGHVSSPLSARPANSHRRRDPYYTICPITVCPIGVRLFVS